MGEKAKSLGLRDRRQKAPFELHHYTLYVFRTVRTRRIAPWILMFAPPDLYLIGLAISGSIILYPGGNMAYIDALFFASGCATQSGLNTLGKPSSSFRSGVAKTRAE